MRVSRFGRIGAVAWPVVIGAVLLASCGSDGASAPSRSTLDLSLESTAFKVKPPTPSTTVAEVEDGTSSGPQTYVIQSGDFPIKIADQFGVPLEDLREFNGWATFDEFPGIGTEILIPPGGVADQETDATTGTGDTPDESDTAGDTATGSGDGCETGTHIVAAGDFPLKLVDVYDVTLDALAAANANNSAYKQFIPGQEIIIPAKSDC